MSLLLLASMPATSPDGPSDAEEGERRRGINAPPEMGNKKCPCLASGGRIPHRIVVSSHCVFWPSAPRRPAPPPAPDPAQGRAPTRTGTRRMDAVASVYRLASSLSPGIDGLRSHVESRDALESRGLRLWCHPSWVFGSSYHSLSCLAFHKYYSVWVAPRPWTGPGSTTGVQWVPGPPGANPVLDCAKSRATRTSPWMLAASAILATPWK